LKIGFSFFKNPKRGSRFGILGIILSGAIVIIYSLLYNYHEVITQSLFVGCIIIAIGIFIWIKKNLTIFYKELIKEDTLLLLQEEINLTKKEKEATIKENATLAEINHKYGHKISELEHYLKKVSYSLNNNVKFSNELSEIAQLVDNLSKEYSEEMTQRIKLNNELPKTKILEIDKMLEYMQSECIKNKISFNVKLKYPIHYLIEKFIPKSKLEILLADHIKNAIIAVNSYDKDVRKIMVTFDVVDNFYEIHISDTGIPFEINTLANLGTEPITTHSDTGGTGYGFITTFKTLNETKANLIIEEHDQNIHTYTKTLIFRFDNKNEYKIHSHRIDEIAQFSENGRIKFL